MTTATKYRTVARAVPNLPPYDEYIIVMAMAEDRSRLLHSSTLKKQTDVRISDLFSQNSALWNFSALRRPAGSWSHDQYFGGQRERRKKVAKKIENFFFLWSFKLTENLENIFTNLNYKITSITKLHFCKRKWIWNSYEENIILWPPLWRLACFCKRLRDVLRSYGSLKLTTCR